MSSHNIPTCETTPLLDDVRPARRSSTGSLNEKSRFSPQTLLIPVVLATRLGNAIPSTTLFELFRKTICRLSNRLHVHPASILRHGIRHGPTPPQLCGSPEVVRDFATVIAAFGVIGGIMSLVGCGILSRILPRYGRKPVFLFMLITEIIWSCLIPVSQFMPDGLADWAFLVAMLLHVISGALPHGYLVDMYIVDVCHPDERTATMSKIGGWSALGVCIPLALGGSITTRTGNPFIVFYMAAVIFLAVFVYVVSVLPETFPEEKRKEKLRTHPVHDCPTRFALVLSIFEPLKMLVPTRTATGKRNWRLTWCAIHTILYVTANAYVFSAWLVLVTSKYDFTPADTGFFFTVVTSTGMIVLSVIVPRLVRFLRPYYPRRGTCSSYAEEGQSSRTSTTDDDSGDEYDNDASRIRGPSTSDHLDVHVAFVGCAIASVAVMCAAVSKTTLQLMLSAVLMGLSWIHHPTTRSLVVGSVDPLRQGEALAAIGMVQSAGGVLSPIVMGSIFTATIDTTPLLLSYIHLVVVLVSATLLLLVRDSDRFHKPNEM